MIAGSKAFISKVNYLSFISYFCFAGNFLTISFVFFLNKQAKVLRKTLGGGMRQVGVLCAAALVAVEENVPKLEGDHKKAKILAGTLFPS